VLRERFVTAAILVSVLLACLGLDFAFPMFGVSGLWLVPLLLFFTFGTSLEFAKLLRGSGRLVVPSLAVTGALATASCAALPLFWPLFGMQYPADCPVGRLGWIGIGAIVGVGLSLAVEMRAYGTAPPGGIERVASAALATSYVGIPMAFFAAIRNLGVEANWGLCAIVTFIAVTKSADTGAFFVGRSFGKHKMVPLLSPGKTWEGAVGGVLLSIAVSYVCIHFLFPALCERAVEAPWWGAPTLGFFCAVAGMYGDLAESYMKRDSGVKDSGGLLPGMGGVWDVTDSLIGASIPAFLCFAAGAVGPVT
jgi:phosphatidate cytidylyltransferase